MTSYDTVYIVWEGEDEDSRVVAAYTDYENARRRAYYTRGIADVEALSVDTEPVQPRYRFDVYFDPYNNEILEIAEIGQFATESPRVVRERYNLTRPTEIAGHKGVFRATINSYRATVYAEDKYNASQKAEDAVAKYKQEEQTV